MLFLSNAPPLYLLLFIAATYILQRPCLYCTLLLFLIIVTLFDFKSNWFGDSIDEPCASTTETPHDAWSLPLKETLKASASLAGSALNESATALVDMATNELQRRTGLRSGWGLSWWSTGVEWVKDIARRRELRIRCINAIIRL